MLRHLNIKELDRFEVTWVKPGQSVGYMQGAALNRLNREYPPNVPGARMGYYLAYQQPMYPEDGQVETGCHYLIERKTRLEANKDPEVILVDFIERGDCVEGYAIYH